MNDDKQIMHACWDALGVVSDELDKMPCNRDVAKLLDKVRAALFQEKLVKPIILKRNSKYVEDALRVCAEHTAASIHAVHDYVKAKYEASRT